MDNITTKHPYLSFEDQLSLLEERNLIIKDTDLALEAIQSFSYYTIVNGYKDLFLKSPYDNEFIDGTTFEMLYQLHWIDLSLCNTLFKYTLAVEKKLKTQVSNLVADCFTINEQRYLLDKNYSPAKGQKGKLRDVEKAIDEIRYRDISAKHYMDEENNLPPWIAAKAISFGNIRNWYSILRDPHKQLIIDAFIGKKTNLTPDTRRDFLKLH
ncbi:Abortive infection bacteriophage resistance protein [Listeria grayi]|uniref:Abortive infection bacteriophage resistance protein n=1 Tax=Listeria grayi TaxID=1641 RepID=A0A378MI55_LISGR|nr:Abi family protein [Listeria grayi]STY45484.1 Abortive infection bacteriophage resistance protein [Listeria grayi]